MMTKREKIKTIIFLLEREVQYALEEYIKAASEVASAKTGHDLWEKENEDDMSWNGNPYRIEDKEDRAKTSLAGWNNTKEVLDYATNTFIDMIEEE